MARSYCPTPDCCTAPKRGICPCQVDALLGHRERMKALNADPEFKAKVSAASRERMKALHADPEFKAKVSAASRERMKALNADPAFKAKVSAASRERMKALHADPEFKAKTSERMKALNAARGHIPVPDHLKSYAAKLRSCGIRGNELRKAIEAAT